MSKTLYVVIAIACLMYLAPVFDEVSADDSAAQRVGGSIQVLDEHRTVTLVAEYVHAWVDPVRKRVQVECVFFLRNSGPAVRVLFGFPEYASGYPPVPFVSFRSLVNGQEVECARERSKGNDEGDIATFWWTKEVSFDSGEVKSVTDFYEATPGVTPDGSQWFRYILWSGASWAGPIGVCDVVVTLGGDLEGLNISSYPEAHYRAGNEFRWHFSDFEPGQGEWPGELIVHWSRLAKDSVTVD